MSLELELDSDTLEPVTFIYGPDSHYSVRKGDLVYTVHSGLKRAISDNEHSLLEQYFLFPNAVWVIALAPVKAFTPTERGWYWVRSKFHVNKIVHYSAHSGVRQVGNDISMSVEWFNTFGWTWLGPVEPYNEYD